MKFGGKDLANSLHKFYTDETLSTSSENSSHVQQLVKAIEGDQVSSDVYITKNTSCRVCKGEKNDNYIILSCDHVFHISCLAEANMHDNRNFQVIEDEFFNSSHCLCCDKIMQTEELVFLYSKFYNGSNARIENHEESITKLETKMKHLKDELRTCYEYKYKLERERDKSKQFVAMLMTMM